ncbi:hypothetical protein [Methanoregula sp.]|uniref:hypothetical protein n=1 Tax=Methanoregula sp. TaxID=2052170 RepID=UPI000CBA8C12|nr:hypothetical protein [Methanoregula sp.]PKG32113.1 MAG: hypothetical protein CW742_09855 [Methanoregula sp.]
MTLAASLPTSAPHPAVRNFGDLVKNFNADRWSAEEIKTVKPSLNRYDALARYREKFPDSCRSDDAVFRQYFNMRPDMRKKIAVWSVEEQAPILAADTVDEAVTEYRRLFPTSTRSDPAIKREWYDLRPEKRGLVPCGRKKGGRNKVPLKGTFREKYLIPMSSKQDPKGYNNAVNVCRKYNKPYDEAIKLREADKAERKRRKEERLLIRQNRAAARTVKKIPKERKPREGRKNPAIAPKTPATSPTVPDIPKSSAGFSPGQKVVHNGSKSSPYFGWTGRIVKIVRSGKSEHLMVSFGKGGAILISDKFVTPAGDS